MVAISYIPNIHQANNNIRKNHKKKIYTVELIGEKYSAKVTSEKIEWFYINFDKHANTYDPSLVKSIELAKKIFEKKKLENKE